MYFLHLESTSISMVDYNFNSIRIVMTTKVKEKGKITCLMQKYS